MKTREMKFVCVLDGSLWPNDPPLPDPERIQLCVGRGGQVYVVHPDRKPLVRNPDGGFEELRF